MSGTETARTQFNIFISRELSKALKLRCIQEDLRLNHLVEDIFAAYLATPAGTKPRGTLVASPSLPMKSILPTVIVGVDDMARSTRLYRDLLGLPCRHESQRWTEFDVGGHTLALHIQDSGSQAKAHGVVTLCIEVPQLDPTVDRLRAAGYTVHGPEEMEGLGRLATFRDPDGVAVSLSQRASS